RRRPGRSRRSSPVASPSTCTIFDEVLTHTPPQLRRFTAPQPVRKAAGSTADNASALQTPKPLAQLSRVVSPALYRHDLRHGLIPVEHQDGAAAFDMVQIAG